MFSIIELDIHPLDQIIIADKKISENLEKQAQANIIKTGWNVVNNRWKFMLEDGTYVKGWLKDNATGKWYFLDKISGEMQAGWIKDNNNKWYFFTSNGEMAANTIINGYELSSDGSWIG